jgi:hypothetical protein
MKGLMGGKKVGPTPKPPASKLPFEIQFTKPAIPEVAPGNQVRMTSTVQIGLSQNSMLESYPVRVSFEFSIVEEENDIGETWPINSQILTKNHDFTVGQKWLKGILHKGKPLEIKVESDPYDSNWTGRLKPRVEEDVKRGSAEE